MRLHVKISRPDINKLQWTIVYGNPELATFPSAVVAADQRVPYPIIAPRSKVPWDANSITAAAVNVASKQVRVGDTETFGRHLFRVLIGDEVLTRIQAHGGLDSIALDCDDKDFSRIPWELLWLGDNFAAAKGIGVTRVFGAPADVPQELLISPVVLFVVGSDLHDPRIRPGAEYLGLLRRLEATNIVMESHVITRATTQMIDDAVRRIRPSIVHFICHGGPPGSDYIELVSEDRAKPFEQVRPEQIADLVGDDPSAIVLNACHTGAASVDSAALAMSIAKKGPPVVIGMAGRVADRACRLFTRRLYESLMTGESIEIATAAARREGMVHGSDPGRTVDWAMPTIFVRDGVRVRMDPTRSAIYAARTTRARNYRQLMDPGLICGRGECLDVHQNLLDGPDSTHPRVLVLKVADRVAAIENPQYGKTRALEEFAARAALRGHVPCLVTFPKTQGAIQAPKTAMELALHVLRAVQKARTLFGLNEHASFEVVRLKQAMNAPHDTSLLAQSVQTQLLLHPLGVGDSQPPAEVIGTALKEDLQALAAESRVRPDIASDARVLVLIDDVHACGEGGRSLVQLWLSDYGLGRLAHTDADWVKGHGPIPVVLTYSAVSSASEIYRSDVEVLRRYIEERPTLFRTCDLRAFSDPKEDDLPYQQFLLSRTPMLVLRGDLRPDERSDYLGTLHEFSFGVPSKFSSDLANNDVHAAIKVAKAMRLLEPADDDESLKRLAEVHS